eukprot:946958-Amorphochlora_amoeboformis.AAC.1
MFIYRGFSRGKQRARQECKFHALPSPRDVFRRELEGGKGDKMGVRMKDIVEEMPWRSRLPREVHRAAVVPFSYG